ncbi:GNAT family N-acetyltransferase [Catellatospora tritici]|uniref:GNAT family N-acetyltransferase n=1 Tax=Catellatospora tritici TaxID=2851566 RepID=UPI001C2D2D47|nr:GNAT family N-acetyltransferase [Catellatospora tritici]MBV1855470.1 GNAT family N-acetyltransferase [Catellatospora tritici]
MTTPHLPVIRPRDLADLPGCVTALAAVHASGTGYPTRWPADPIAWLTPGDVEQGWVALLDDMVVGHVLLRDTPGHGHNISRLFVSPAAQGAGVASALLGAAVDWARARELPLMLEVTAHAAAAIALYERTGWRRTGTSAAAWTAPDGSPVTVHRYVLEA